MMDNFEHDLHYLNEALEELEKYLLSDQVYWPMDTPAEAGQPGYPKLTAGNLLFFMAHAAADAASPAQQATVQQLQSQLYALTTHWHSAWQSKVAQEYASRLRQWSIYLNELVDDPERHAAFYPTEVRLRTLLELLKQEAETALEDLAPLDALLSQYLQKGKFIWQESEAAAFPNPPYWFLYGCAKEQV